MMQAGGRGRGFTLIELMIVVAIIGILAAIAIPKFASLIRKSSESYTKGNLAAMRSSLYIYYGDMEGNFPSDLFALTMNSKYMSTVPIAKLPNYHPDASSEKFGSATAQPDDSTAWIYGNVIQDNYYGVLNVNCTHTDTKGSVWTMY